MFFDYFLMTLLSLNAYTGFRTPVFRGHNTYTVGLLIFARKTCLGTGFGRLCQNLVCETSNEKSCAVSARSAVAARSAERARLVHPLLDKNQLLDKNELLGKNQFLGKKQLFGKN